jgi:AcrR family transcriptional regulator
MAGAGAMTVVMTIVTNRTRPRAELRDSIFEASMRLFRAQGYGATSVDEVVAAAGVAKGTFFNFFPSKLDVMKDYYAGVDLEIATCRAEMDPASPLEALRAYASKVEHILLAEGRIIRELLELAMGDPSLRRIDHDSGARDADDFADYLAIVQALGLIEPAIAPAGAVSALIDLWAGAMRSWLARPKEVLLAALFGERIDLLFRGLGYRS